MERRTFIKGAFGFAVLVSGAGLGTLAAQGGTFANTARGTQLFATSGVSPELANGPLMQAGIEVFKLGSGDIIAYFGDTQLFTVDGTGAELVRLADGSRSIEAIALEASSLTGAMVAPAEVASFFVTLGQAGYLQNTVFVNLLEIPE